MRSNKQFPGAANKYVDAELVQVWKRTYCRALMPKELEEWNQQIEALCGNPTPRVLERRAHIEEFRRELNKVKP